MVHQSAGGRHHDLGLFLQLSCLSHNAGAAVEHRHTDALVIGQQRAQLVTDLNRQLPGRCQDQTLYIRAFRVNMLDHGNAEGKGLAGTGRRFGDHILPLHKFGDRLLLDGGGVAVALLFQCFEHLLGKPQVFKCNLFHDISSFFRFFLIIAGFVQLCNKIRCCP